MMLPRFTSECEEGYHTDPLLSKIDCEHQTLPLQKLIHANLKATDPDLFHLWDALRLDNDEIHDLMARHAVAGGGHATMQGAACSWLKSRVDHVNWHDWLQIQDRCPQPHLEWDDAIADCVEIAADAEQEDPAGASKAGVSVWLIATFVLSFVLASVLLVGLYLLLRKVGRSPAHMENP